MTKVEIDEKVLKEMSKWAKIVGKSREEVVSEALQEYINKYFYPYWREKGTLKKKKGQPWEGRIPETQYKPEQK